MSSYAAVEALHRSLPPFSPLLPVESLPYLAFTLLSATFALAFYLSIIPKQTIPLWETTIATVASTFAGFGVVALFCSVGVYL